MEKEMEEENQNPVEETNEEVQTPEETPEPPAEETPEEEPLQEEQEPEDSEEIPEVEEEPKPPVSRRAALRISKLVDQQLQQRQQPTQVQPQGMNYRDAIEGPDELYNQLEQDRRQYGDQIAGQLLQQNQSNLFRTRLEIDAPKVESKHKFLDSSDKANFNPVAADAVNNWYLAMSGFDQSTGSVNNPNIRYSDFVEGLVELADEIASNKVAKSSKNIARQAANTGLRPDGSSSKRLNLNKAPGQMSDEELEAVIGQAIPKR